MEQISSRETRLCQQSCSTCSPFTATSLQSFGDGVSNSFQPLPKPHPPPDFLPELPGS